MHYSLHSESKKTHICLNQYILHYIQNLKLSRYTFIFNNLLPGATRLSRAPNIPLHSLSKFDSPKKINQFSVLFILMSLFTVYRIATFLFPALIFIIWHLRLWCYKHILNSHHSKWRKMKFHLFFGGTTAMDTIVCNMVYVN